MRQWLSVVDRSNASTVLVQLHEAGHRACHDLTALVGNEAWHGSAVGVHNGEGVVRSWSWHGDLLASFCERHCHWQLGGRTHRWEL